VSAAEPANAAWDDALQAACALAVDPQGLGGAWLRARPGPARDAWLQLLREALPEGAPWRRIPAYIGDGRLLGGLDLTATLAAGRPVAERGVLAEADGGMVVLPMAERATPALAARLAQVIDAGGVLTQRDGLALAQPARFALVALDESVDDETPEARALLDRLALLVDLDSVAPRAAVAPAVSREHIAQARARLAAVTADAATVRALTAAALALGVASLRAPLAALRAARSLAALAGRTRVSDDDAALAARLVLAPRATQLPADEEAAAPPEAPPPGDAAADSGTPDRPLDDVVLAAARAAIPPALLARLAAGVSRGAARAQGRSGAAQSARARGRPVGTRRGELRGGARLNVIETLRAAAPWQPLRRRAGASAARIAVRPDDFRITRLKQRRQTTTLFVVDASGSQALHRLAEAKGAVELLLADCYVRRDRVALIAFRGERAELVLPPTRSLVRAKRTLAGMPGGGGTPLAAGLEAATELADALARRGDTPVVVLLTDGRANVARDGRGGRAAAQDDARRAAQGLRATGHAVVLIDTSPRPDAHAAAIAADLGARYVPLPRADAQAVSRAVQSSL